MKIQIPVNDEKYCSCYVHPIVEDQEKGVYCRAVHAVLQRKYLRCPDCPLMLFDTENQRYFGCYYYDTEASDYQTDQSRIDIAISEGRLPRFPYFEEKDRHLVEHALQFAAEAHKTQRRKGADIPYMTHLLEVSGIIHKMTEDADVIAAGALHDVLEDTDVSEEELRAEFGDHIVDLVKWCTENKRPDQAAEDTWMIRKTEALEHYKKAPLDGKRVALADKLSNMRSSYGDYILEGDRMWEKFNQKDISLQAWYYRSIVDIMVELKDTDAYQEFRDLTEKVFITV